MEAGAWGCQIPNKFCPVSTRGGTCSTIRDLNGAYSQALARVFVNDLRGVSI
nr:MAG TPA: hypothetical protein [Bacteriophage sp.]